MDGDCLKPVRHLTWANRTIDMPMLYSPRHSILCVCLALVVSAPSYGQEAGDPDQNPDAARYIQAPPEIAAALATDKNFATLRYMSPDRDHFLVPHTTELSTLDLMSRQTYRLAELEIRPQTDRLWHLDTFGIDSFRFFSIKTGRFVDVELPEGSFASDFTWSPKGERIAFLAHLPTHTEVWTSDATSGETRSLSHRRVLATIGTSGRGQGTRPSGMLQWLPGGEIVTLLVPEDRGEEPARNPVPLGPVTRRTREKPMSTPTYPNLLDNEHDEMLFERYTTSQISEISADGAVRAVGQAGMYQSISASPDGGYLLATRIERPFTYRASYRAFPRRTVVLDVTSGEEVELDYRALQEGRRSGSGGNGGPRAFAWLPDGSGLGFLERAAKNEDEPDADRPDQLKRAPAPFDLENAEVLVSSDDPIGNVTMSRDGTLAFAAVSSSGKEGLAFWRLGTGQERSMLLDFHDSEDPTEDPGDLLTERTANGLAYAVVSGSQQAAYLQGDGYRSDFRPRPFIDRISLSDGSSTRVFEGSSESYERPLAVLDPELGQLIASRESQDDYPDSYLVSDGQWTRLTRNVDPFPAVTAARRIDFEFERRDGLKVQGRVSLPIGYQEGDHVPAIFWTYPREYTTPERYENAAVRSRNRNAFTHMSWLRWSNLWLTQGYALVYPDIPIVGENYNDTYIGNLVDAMYGAIRAVDRLDVIDIDRIGHGGHSYGAFATANILANAPFFKAGIAGDGAYNRSLTPAGFQAERRSIWEAPATYIEMSPFFKADQIDTPMLMYHGGDDNNTGTFPIQSRRMIQALTEQGKTAVLYEYPYESHTPRAIENKRDMWGRFIGWFDQYVKGVESETEPASDES
jgi:dipeptidyl aminopeptidase/acylaminoacyl peptidase